jgi:capsular polysaccharide biosynthesis protein
MTMTDLWRKVVRRARKYYITLAGYLPANRKYVPIGITSVLAKKGHVIEYLELSAPYESTLNLSQEFISDCSDFVKPTMTIQVPGDYVVSLKNGRVYSYDASNMAIITSDNYLVAELSFQWEIQIDSHVPPEKNKVFRMKGLLKPKKFAGTVFSLLAGGGAKTYYYHWMIDSIPKLGLLKQIGRFDEVDYFLVPSNAKRFQKETLSHFGISEDKIILEDSVQHLQADRLILTSYTQLQFHHPKWACDFLHSSFTLPGNHKTRDKLVYVARGDAGVNRKVLNETELIDVLKEYGFAIRYLSHTTVTEEAEFFNLAKLVIGAHGSNLTNLVFCEPGTIVIELFPDKYVRHDMHDICNKMGLEYHYLLCPSEGEPVNTVDGQKLHLTADIPAIRAMVEKWV